MNTMQLYLSIGIPTITVILAWLSSRAEAACLNEKIDRVNESLTAKTESQGASLRAELIAI